MRCALLLLVCFSAMGCGRRTPPVILDPIKPPVIIDPGIPTPPSETVLSLPQLVQGFSVQVGRTVFLRGVEQVVKEVDVPGGYRLMGGGVSLNAADSNRARELFAAMPRLMGVEITVIPHEVSGELPPQWVEVIDFRPEGTFQQTLSMAQLASQIRVYEGRSVTVTGGIGLETEYWPSRHFRLLDPKGNAIAVYQDDQSERLFNYFRTGAIHGVDLTGIVHEGRLVIQRYRTYRS